MRVPGPGEGLLVVVPGIALGVLGAVEFARLMQGLLFGWRHSTRGVRRGSLGLAVTSVLACLGPALRAAAADPVVTLRK